MGGLLALDDDLEELVKDTEEDLGVGLDPLDEREGKEMREVRFALTFGVEAGAVGTLKTLGEEVDQT